MGGAATGEERWSDWPPGLPREVVFLPADPPREGRFAFFATEAAPGLEPPLGIVVSQGRVVRRRDVPACRLSVAEALPVLLGAAGGTWSESARAWATAVTAGLGLLARGRLVPAVTPGGWDAWRVGPLDPADLAWLHSLAEAFPALAHSVPLPEVRPLRMPSPGALVRAAWDAVADALVRTAAAELVAGGPLLAATEPQPAAGLRPWLADASRGLEGGASVGLRLELLDPDDAWPADGFDLDERSRVDEDHAVARLTLQMRSSADPSLIVDAADLWRAPAAVLARFGPQAEADLLLSLRRGQRAWPPLSPLLAAAAPTALELSDEGLAELLDSGAEALASAGIEVLWPRELVSDGLAIRGSLTPSPGAIVGSGLDLESLLDFRWQLTLDGEALTEEEVDALAEAKRTLVRVRGRWVVVDAALVAKVRGRRSGRPRRLTAGEALGALLAGEMEVDGQRVEVTAAPGPLSELAERLGGLDRELADALPPPAGLVAQLRPYQARGVGWLVQMCEAGLGGCLADDMGLGKTIQVIALHLHRTAGRAPGPTLVVCPTSVLGNWERELNRFAPEVPVRRYHGGSRHLEDLDPAEVVLATYGVLRRDREALAAAGFSLVVADEAQHAKNPLSDTAKALRGVPAQARVALTGTPVENRLSDLWAVLDWTTPGLLGPLDRFRRLVAVPIERYRDAEAASRLSRMARPFLLRRRKSDPAIAPELPPKTETDRLVPLTPEQATLYEAVVRETMALIRDAEGMDRRGLVFKLLTGLKQICNHPAQYLHEPGPVLGRSGKLAALDELLDIVVAEGESALVFTQYAQMGRLLQAHLDERGLRTRFLHGGVATRQRDEMVAAFQAGEFPVLLLSLKAGGVGLNLTRATHVVHYDRWWNPAVEDQATDRAYRIGQDRPVQVHRLLAEGTLEDRIAQVLERKRELAEAVVGEGEAWLTELSDDELVALVELGAAS